jgi:multidrug resistance efflux pump
LKRGWIVTTLPVALATALIAGCASPAASPTAAPAQQPTMVLAAPTAPAAESAGTAGDLPAAPAGSFDLGVTGTGEVLALQTADLTFQVPGTVGEVLVEEGMIVTEGQVLASLITADIELQIRQAEASLAAANADYERVLEGATEEEVRAAQAQLAQAQAGLRTTRGSVTDQDISAAQAQLEQARAQLARLEAGPRTTDVQGAQAGVDQARAQLQLQRDSLSAQKTSAQLAMEQSANQLRDAQAQYSTIYWQNRELEGTLAGYGSDLPQEARDAEDAALRAVQNAEANLERSRVSFENAKQAEMDGIAASEAGVRSAEAQLDRVLAGADSDQLAGARAQVASAQASLNRLLGEQRAGQLASAQAGVAAAQAQLDKATADPTESSIAGAQAQILQAEVGLSQAKRNLEKATLRAPFAGQVARVEIDPGDLASTGPMAIQVVDLSKLRVEVNISDTDVARVRDGQAAEVRVDAIPGKVFTGNVIFIAPTATVTGTIRTFLVRIELTEQEGLRSGMSARVAIIP